MLQYLIILLDDTAVSYCHYKSSQTEKRLISPDDLRAGILFAMKQNLVIQFVYPSYDIPPGHKEIIETIDHFKIMPSDAEASSLADVCVFNSCREFMERKDETNGDKVYLLRADMQELINRVSPANLAETGNRVNVVITDVDACTENDLNAYKLWLADVGSHIALSFGDSRQLAGNNTPSRQAGSGKLPQINLLTDRISLEKMNNCNAGCSNITLAPNGKFYLCPAFYYENENDSIGDPAKGVDIKNRHLYRLEYAPLCRRCDAYQCKRCVWLNRKTTGEVNTPSHEQCVAAHLERNVSRDLLNALKNTGNFAGADIPAIDYLDPFDVREQF